jgi:predicted  nucleic acid-binding Zn-ribbon protein
MDVEVNCHCGICGMKVTVWHRSKVYLLTACAKCGNEVWKRERTTPEHQAWAKADLAAENMSEHASTCKEVATMLVNAEVNLAAVLDKIVTDLRKEMAIKAAENLKKNAELWHQFQRDMNEAFGKEGKA